MTKKKLNIDLDEEKPKAPHKRKPVEPRKDGAIYKMTKWKGLDNFQCLFCGFASLHRDRIIEHYTTRHAIRKAEPRIVDTGLVTETGQPIGRVEEPAEKE